MGIILSVWGLVILAIAIFGLIDTFFKEYDGGLLVTRIFLCSVILLISPMIILGFIYPEGLNQ